MRGPGREPVPAAGRSPGGLGLAPSVLEVRDLVTRFRTRAGVIHAVNGVSWSLHAGESLALVGESGSGKSVSALSVMGLVPPPGRVEGGEVRLRGSDLLGLTAAGWRRIRGKELAMVFQDPMTSLNPVLAVGRQVTEVLREHTTLRGREAKAEAIRLLTRVGIPDAGRRHRDFPHQFSGGQRQRVMIAMALACKPAVLVADEPTTALDVTVQAQIVALVRELQAELGMAVLWITHDLALVAGLVDRVAVMYGGRIVEEAPVAELFGNPRHPYTRGLLASMPRMDDQDPAALPESGPAPGSLSRLAAIEGRPPDLRVPAGEALPDLCAFAPRCPHATDLCWAEMPPLQSVSMAGEELDHRSACWLWEELDRPEGDGP
ncbi:MAG TPA: ABC transporter ATP-binding protein [Longimicrobiales bacterium]|nr:ABC transporter ATP-binding protein [Longimicrobiales bacterium]